MLDDVKTGRCEANTKNVSVVQMDRNSNTRDHNNVREQQNNRLYRETCQDTCIIQGQNKKIPNTQTQKNKRTIICF